MIFCVLLVFGAFLTTRSCAQPGDTATINPIIRGFLSDGMRTTHAYDLLARLVKAAPHRLSGSKGASDAVAWATATLKKEIFDNVQQESVMVPHWVRGTVERAEVIGRHSYRLAVCALGGSVPTPQGGLTAEVVEVHSLEEAHALGVKGKGKIVFFNRPMDVSRVGTFEAYGGAVDQRARGAIEAAKVGGVAALVRSMTMKADRVPHTGVMVYQDSVEKVPSAAVSLVDADSLSALLKRNPSAKVRLTLDCHTLHDAPSANVMGEILGREKPEEVVVVGGHLDSWDKGEGAVDDGSGCVQAIEALRLIQKLDLHPKRTIRAVLFMNEENGNRGGTGYANDPVRKTERPLAVIESDRGGFAPRGFDVAGDSTLLLRTHRWMPLFAQLNAEEWGAGFGGTDISPMIKEGVPGFGLVVESQRYFDYHHSENNVLSAINPRELELGAIVEALLCYLIAEEGI